MNNNLIGTPPGRISAADAAEIIGRRFYGSGWTSTDIQMLAFAEDDAADREAWNRATGVEKRLEGYITQHLVTAYSTTDDGEGLTQLPIRWVTQASFKVSLLTGQFRVWSDQWDRIWIDRRELEAAVPKQATAREKHTHEWKPIVHEAWKFALSQPTLPIKARIVDHLGAWCPDQGLPVPDGSALHEVAREVWDFLAENKTGQKILIL